MNMKQKTRIEEMRSEGCSYAAIAQEIGVNENTVKSYCRRNGLTAETAAPALCNIPGVSITRCKKCGKTVYQFPGRKEKKFCSDVCRNRWWSEHLSEINRKTMIELTCPCCGKTFYAYEYRKRKYCSHECYIAHRFGEASCD